MKKLKIIFDEFHNWLWIYGIWGVVIGGVYLLRYV